MAITVRTAPARFTKTQRLCLTLVFIGVTLLLVVMVSIGIARSGELQAQSIAPVSDCTDALDGSNDYELFYTNAALGYMQLVTIPWYEGMDVLDDYGYLDASDVLEGADKIAYHTFAISGVGLDARTGMGCFAAWSFDGRADSEGYGEAFCISAPDMRTLFDNGAYFLAYRSY